METKIVQRDSLVEKLNRHRHNGEIIVFTNGCFDLLHLGHVRYLHAARQEGHRLVVGINSDASVQAIKGPLRPIVPLVQRQEVLAHLVCVDYVIAFDEPDPGDLIKTLMPDVLVKGADWPLNKIIGADTVMAASGRVVRIDMVPEVSTSELIDRIVKRYGNPADG